MPEPAELLPMPRLVESDNNNNSITNAWNNLSAGLRSIFGPAGSNRGDLRLPTEEERTTANQNWRSYVQESVSRLPNRVSDAARTLSVPEAEREPAESALRSLLNSLTSDNPQDLSRSLTEIRDLSPGAFSVVQRVMRDQGIHLTRNENSICMYHGGPENVRSRNAVMVNRDGELSTAPITWNGSEATLGAAVAGTSASALREARREAGILAAGLQGFDLNNSQLMESRLNGGTGRDDLRMPTAEERAEANRNWQRYVQESIRRLPERVTTAAQALSSAEADRQPAETALRSLLNSATAENRQDIARALTSIKDLTPGAFAIVDRVLRDNNIHIVRNEQGICMYHGGPENVRSRNAVMVNNAGELRTAPITWNGRQATVGATTGDANSAQAVREAHRNVGLLAATLQGFDLNATAAEVTSSRGHRIDHNLTDAERERIRRTEQTFEQRTSRFLEDVRGRLDSLPEQRQRAAAMNLITDIARGRQGDLVNHLQELCNGNNAQTDVTPVMNFVRDQLARAGVAARYNPADRTFYMAAGPDGAATAIQLGDGQAFRVFTRDGLFSMSNWTEIQPSANGQRNTSYFNKIQHHVVNRYRRPG